MRHQTPDAPPISFHSMRTPESVPFKALILGFDVKFLSTRKQFLQHMFSFLADLIVPQVELCECLHERDHDEPVSVT